MASRGRDGAVSQLLVIETAWLGDVVFVSSLVQALKIRWPDARLTLLCAPRGRDVGACMPGVDEVLVYDKHGADRGATALLRLGRALRARRFDLCVAPHRSARSAVVAALSGAPVRVGYASVAGAVCFTTAVPGRGGRFAERDLALARALGIDAAPPPRLELTGAAREQAAAVLASKGVGPQTRLAGLVLGSEWATKRWPAARFGEAGRALLAQGLTPLLLGAPGEKALAAEVLAACPGAVDTVGNPILEALGLLGRCELVIGGDSGLVHAARALGKPAVVLFGPTDPELHRWRDADRPVWLALECAPCSAHGQRTCPLGHHRCMKDLPVETVLGAARELAPS